MPSPESPALLPPARPGLRGFRRWSAGLALGLALQPLLVPGALALRDIPIDHGIYRETDAALGINDDFGRWDGPVRLVYDPDGAPALFASDAHFLELLESAVSQWQRVSGIQFVITGVDRSAPDDSAVGATRDGNVRVFWGTAGGAAGRAGPDFGAYNSNRGYFPYEDGSVELNNTADAVASDFDMTAVLAHELGHLLGLGHSDNPDSIMYANPYNHLNYPRADDIRIMQALYGAPATAIDIDRPQATWVYTVPPAASSTVTQYLFKPNQFPGSTAAFLSVGGTTITSITSATADGEFVMLNPGGVGNHNNNTAIDINATVVLVDPFGYVHDRSAWEITCAVRSACSGGGIGTVQTQIAKTMPGNWKIHVVDESAGVSNATLLLTMTLPVTTTAAFNQAPTATLTVAAGATASRATFTLTATDPESNGIEVVWRPPGNNDWDGDFVLDSDIRNTFASGGSASRTFDFTQTGTHTFYVEVRDNQARYSPRVSGSSVPGDGFQTLLKVTVTLPLAATPTLQVVSNQVSDDDTGTSDAVLTAIAKTPANQTFVMTSDKTATTASFTFGASSDQGTTLKTTFTVGDSVIIAGGVNPQAADVGKAADIFIVVRTTTAAGDSWTYRTTSGTYATWNGFISTLQPAASVSSLKTSEAFEIHSGTLIAAQHRVFIGYRLGSSTVLHYTGQAMSLTVAN